MPLSLILSSIILAGGLLVGLNNVANSLRNGLVAGNTAAQDNNQPAGAVTVTPEQIRALFQQDNIKFGDENRKVLFVMVSDPSCPYCHIAGGLNPELNKQAGAQFTMSQDGGSYVAPLEEMRELVEKGQASLVWLYSNGHGNGELSTKALYCAYEKGKFWEAHDLLMTNDGYDFINNVAKNDTSKIGEVANFLSSAVKPADMKSCLESGKYDRRIADDQAIAASLGVQGTPGFFVNTTNFAGAYSYNDMKSVVEAALAQ